MPTSRFNYLGSIPGLTQVGISLARRVVVNFKLSNNQHKMPSASKDSYFLSVVYNSNSVKILGNVVYTRQRSLTKGFSNCDKKSKMYQQSIYISRSISEKRVRLVSSNMFKPSSNFLLTVSRRCFFCGSFFVICVSCLSVILPVLSAPCSLVVT